MKGNARNNSDKRGIVPNESELFTTSIYTWYLWYFIYKETKDKYHNGRLFLIWGLINIFLLIILIVSNKFNYWVWLA